jgi:hypothetical protein
MAYGVLTSVGWKPGEFASNADKRVESGAKSSFADPKSSLRTRVPSAAVPGKPLIHASSKTAKIVDSNRVRMLWIGGKDHPMMPTISSDDHPRTSSIQCSISVPISPRSDSLCPALGDAVQIDQCAATCRGRFALPTLEVGPSPVSVDSRQPAGGAAPTSPRAGCSNPPAPAGAS